MPAQPGKLSGCAEICNFNVSSPQALYAIAVHIETYILIYIAKVPNMYIYIYVYVCACAKPVASTCSQKAEMVRASVSNR